MFPVSGSKEWVEVVKPKANMALQANTVLQYHDIASHAAPFMFTSSLRNLRSTSRGYYHAYNTYLDRRLVELFNLIVETNATHRQVMEALLRQIPAGETKRVVACLNELLSQHAPDILLHLLYRVGVDNRPNVKFQISTPKPFTTRERLLKLVGKACMDHVENNAFFISSVIEYFKTPETLRFLLAVARRLPATAFQSQLLASHATGALSRLASAEDDLCLGLYWKAFKVRWNAMNVYEQAASSLPLLCHSLEIDSIEHPVVPIVRDFLTDESLVWANPSLKAACSYICEGTMQKMQGNSEALHPDISELLFSLLRFMGTLSGNKEPVVNCIASMIDPVISGKELPVFGVLATGKAVEAEIQTDMPSPENLCPRLFEDPQNESLRAAFLRFKEGLKHLSASEQARAVNVMYEHAVNARMLELLKEFSENEFLGWKDPSIQMAFAYLVDRRLNFPHTRWSHEITIHDMLKMIAFPAYEYAQEEIFRCLANLIKCCRAEDGVQEAQAECDLCCRQLAEKMLQDYSITANLFSQEQADLDL